MDYNNYNILVLGDSFATSFGCFSNNFLDYLKNDYAYDKKITIYNPSVFNITSSDAVFILKDYLKKIRIDSVVFALGNCDCCAFGFHKRAIVKKSDRRNCTINKKYNTKIKKKNNILKRYPPFTYKIPPKSKRPDSGSVTPTDYGRNIKVISELCKQNEIPLIYLNISANKYFPPCNNIGNYTYAKIFGMNTTFEYSGMGDFPELNSVLSDHDQGNYKSAITSYQLLTENSSNSECCLIALNNISAIYFDIKDYTEAKCWLKKAEKYKHHYLYPVILFNLAILEKKLGKGNESEELFLKAFELDYSSYRIQDLYKAVAKNCVDTKLYLDLDTILDSSDFVDYCHPLPRGHIKVAKQLNFLLQKALPVKNGSQKIELVYEPYNPDSSVGFETDFYTHFNISTTPNATLVVDLLKDKASYSSAIKRANNLVQDLKSNTINTIKAHPLFGAESFLKERHPIYKTDQGRVPEFFFIRQMLPAYEYVKSNPKVLSSLASLKEYTADISKIKVWWKSIKLPNITQLSIPTVDLIESLDWENILTRSEQLLMYTTENKSIFANRVRSITNWFMREALIFGAVSSYSMLYQRKSFWYIADTCLYYQAFAKKTPEFNQRVSEIIKITSSIIDIHNKYCTQISLSTPDKNIISRYIDELKKLKEIHFD